MAVAINGDALTYARALADLEQYRPERLNLALAANGGSLTDRIARLLGQSRNPSRTLPGPGILFAAILIAITGYGLFAQTNSRPPAIATTNLEVEVATVKPFVPDGSRGVPMGIRGGPGTSDADRISFTSSLKGFLMAAYGVGSDYISGPAWLDTNPQLYVITATIRPGATKEQVSQMLQNLLNQRFQTIFHRETRDVRLYELTIAGKGPQLKDFVANSYDDGKAARRPAGGGPDPAYGRGRPEGLDFPYQYASDGINHAVANKVSIAQLTKFLSAQFKRPVIDKTGLAGLYNYNLDFMPFLPGTGEDLSTASAPDLITAIRVQLGMKLTAKKGPLEVIIIDHAEKTPIEN